MAKSGWPVIGHRLAGDRAQAGELRAVELDEIVVVRVLVAEGFQHAGIVFGRILRSAAAQLGQVFFFSHSDLR